MLSVLSFFLTLAPAVLPQGGLQGDEAGAASGTSEQYVGASGPPSDSSLAPSVRRRRGAVPADAALSSGQPSWEG